MNGKNGKQRLEAGAGNFGECLIEGSAEDKKRGRRMKRRAIAVSIALQSVGLTALVIAPMLAKPAEIRATSVMPIPPYSAPRTPRTVSDPQPDRTVHHVCVVCPSMPISPVTKSFTKEASRIGEGNEKLDIEGAIPGGEEGLIHAFEPRSGPRRPEETPHEKKRLIVGHIAAAMLVQRIEPVYPTIPKQLHRSGKVELHALIATDGTIQSLQVVSGDPMFVQSALDAVRQWRYRPTLLNGQAVEVDTFITVIYTSTQQ